MPSRPLPWTKPSALRSTLGLFALAALLGAAPALHASSITYDVTLSPNSGLYGGTGTITLASTPSAYGVSTYTAASNQLQGLTFTVDGQTFSLAGDPWASVEFLNGQIYNISFSQTVGYSPRRFTLDTSSVYAFYSSNGLTESAGSITATPEIAPPDSTPSGPTGSPPTSPTPEPGSLLLLATALLGGGFLVLRRNRTAHS